ncbi:MAG: PadR family transcriptional regulator [Thaumarchaeota archaeon]|nr:PadR family transcriptional regulator [Nitrososphaerota archaeon]
MSGIGTRRWMHPQTVPRGFLRLYILSLLSKKPETGYSIMQVIDEKTEGAWRPGPGTVYPLLRSLVEDGLAKPLSSKEKETSVAYSLTKEGVKEFEVLQQSLIGAGKRQKVMFRLFSDLLSPEVSAKVFVKRSREMFEIFQDIIGQVSAADRAMVLKELKGVLDEQAAWTEAELSRRTKRVER